MGQDNYEANKYMIDKNPNMNLVDIIAILDSMKNDMPNFDDQSSVTFSNDDSSDVHAGDLEQADMDALSDMILEINREISIEKSIEEEKKEPEEASD